MEERFVFLVYATLLISIEIENLIYTTPLAAINHP